MIQVNLIPGRTRERFARIRRTRAWVLGLLAYASCLALGGVAIRIGLRTTAGDIAHQIEVVQNTLKLQENQQSRTRLQMTGLRNQIDAARATGRHPNWGILLDLVSQSLSNRTVLDVVELRKNRIEPPRDAGKGKSEDASVKKAPQAPRTEFVIVLKGRSQSVDAMGEFLVGLERYKVFRQVKLGDNKRLETPTGSVIEFDVSCLLESNEQIDPTQPGGDAK